MSQNERRQIKNEGQRARRYAHLGLLLGLGAMLILQYQNCAPTQMVGPEGEPLLNDEPQLVTVIDDTKADAKVSFPDERVEIHSQVRTLEVTGNCSVNQDGAKLGWSLVDGADQSELARGFVFCEQGKFTVDLMSAQNLQCGHEYRVTARLGMGEAGVITIERRCEPLLSLDASLMKAQLNIEESSTCQIERGEAGDGTASCTAVCYDQRGVVASEQELDPASCY